MPWGKTSVELHVPSYSSSTVKYLQHLSREWTHMLCTVWYYLSGIKAKHSRHFPNKKKTQRIISWGQTGRLIHLELLATPAELGHSGKVAGVTTSKEQVRGSKHLGCGSHSLQRLGVVLARTTVAVVVIYVWGGLFVSLLMEIYLTFGVWSSQSSSFQSIHASSSWGQDTRSAAFFENFAS